MYHRSVQNGYQNSQEDAFRYLNNKFSGRGLALQVKTSAGSYGAEGVYSGRGSASSPLTLGEFEQNYRSRSIYAQGVLAKTAAQPAEHPRVTERHANAANTLRNSSERTSSARAASTGQTVKSERSHSRPPQTAKAPVKREKAPVAADRVRRAVRKDEGKKTESINLLVRNFRHLPVGAMLTVVICAVSLMFIVGSSVLMNDASSDYVDIQNEIASLAKQEDELLIALEVKNDLRVIEDIAVNKLGMVKKDLVTREYIKLSDEDVIETFEDDDNNVGLSTLLSAIKGGN